MDNGSGQGDTQRFRVFVKLNKNSQWRRRKVKERIRQLAEASQVWVTDIQPFEVPPFGRYLNYTLVVHAEAEGNALIGQFLWNIRQLPNIQDTFLILGDP